MVASVVSWVERSVHELTAVSARLKPCATESFTRSHPRRHPLVLVTPTRFETRASILFQNSARVVHLSHLVMHSSTTSAARSPRQDTTRTSSGDVRGKVHSCCFANTLEPLLLQQWRHEHYEPLVQLQAPSYSINQSIRRSVNRHARDASARYSRKSIGAI